METALGREPTTLKLGDKDVELHYGMASFFFLSTKYGGDIREIFGIFKPDSPVDAAFIQRLTDIIYAGLWTPDDDGIDTSSWSTFKVMQLLRMDQIPQITAVVQAALAAAMPKAGPTKPAKAPAKKAGTGITSTPQDGSSSP
jgi:hypothetical protein